MEIQHQNRSKKALLAFFLLTFSFSYSQGYEKCEGELMGVPDNIVLLPEMMDTITSLSMAYTSNFCKSSTKMADFISEMPKLNRLYILASGLTEYSSTLGDFSALEHLYLNNYPGEMIPEEISKLKRLKTLQITKSSNLLSLPINIGNMKDLKNFRCDSSKIEEFPISFQHLESLEFLQFGSSTMTEFPEEIMKLKNGLLQLKLNTPKLKALPNNFGDLKFHPKRVDSAGLKKGRILLVDCESLEYLPASIRKAHCILVLENPKSLRSLSSLNERNVGFKVMFINLNSGFQTRRLLRSLDTGEKLSLNFTDAKHFRMLPHSLLRLKKLTKLEISGFNGDHPRKPKRFLKKLKRKLPHTRVIIRN